MIYLEIATKLVIGLAGLLAVTRLLGKKEMSQVTPFDFIYALVLGGILEEGLYDEKVSIWQILFAICLWGISVYIIEICAQKSDRMKKLLKGHPSLIIRNGELDIKQMKKITWKLNRFEPCYGNRGCSLSGKCEIYILSLAGTSV
nr:YetF domain-containing protein [Peribacillus frigoritolerans]